MRTLPFGLLALLLLPSIAFAGDSKGAVLALERGAGRLARTAVGDRGFNAFSGSKLGIEVNPQRKIIVVYQGLSQQGFFLQGDGRLSPADRTRLTSLLDRSAPDISASRVLQTLRTDVKRMHQHDRAVKGVDPIIGKLLGEAGGKSRETVLWTGSRTWTGATPTITYRPEADVLVAKKGYISATALPVRRTPQGLQLTPESLTQLREFLYRYGK